MISRSCECVKGGGEVESSQQNQPDPEVRKLAALIADPRQRKSFARDPDKALADAGIDVDRLPAAVRDTLYDLSYEELRAVSRVQASLRDAGVSDPDINEIF
jgi:hypothetical protein